MKKKYLVIISIMLACLAGLILMKYDQTNASEDTTTAAVGVYVENIDVSGMTVKEIRKAVKKYVADVAQQTVTLKVGDEKIEVSAGDLGYSWQNKDIVTEAVEYAQSGNVIKRYTEKADLNKKGEKVFSVKMETKEKKLKKKIKEVAAELGSNAKNASLELTSYGFEIIPEESGYTIDIDEAVKVVYDYMESDWATDSVGVVEVPMTEEMPEYTTEDCEKVSSTPMGSYTTTFTVSSDATNRNLNIKNGVSKLDGLVIYPGEEISCNERFAPWTAENGYYEAGAYINGEVSTDMGGGICQVSTTLYNALLLAEIDITERYSHSLTVHYVPLSADAAVNGGYKDLKFQNNTDAPIYIEGLFYSSGSVTFNVYGHDTRDSNRTIEYVSEKISTISPDVEVTKDSSKPVGYEEITEEGYTGYVAKLWKYIYLDGELQDKELVNSSTYSTTSTKKIVGTKKTSDDDDDEETTTKKSKDKTTKASDEETTTKKKKTEETTTAEETITTDESSSEDTN